MFSGLRQGLAFGATGKGEVFLVGMKVIQAIKVWEISKTFRGTDIQAPSRSSNSRLASGSKRE